MRRETRLRVFVETTVTSADLQERANIILNKCLFLVHGLHSILLNGYRKLHSEVKSRHYHQQLRYVYLFLSLSDKLLELIHSPQKNTLPGRLKSGNLVWDYPQLAKMGVMDPSLRWDDSFSIYKSVNNALAYPCSYVPYISFNSHTPGSTRKELACRGEVSRPRSMLITTSLSIGSQGAKQAASGHCRP